MMLHIGEEMVKHILPKDSLPKGPQVHIIRKPDGRSGETGTWEGLPVPLSLMGGGGSLLSKFQAWRCFEKTGFDRISGPVAGGKYPGMK
jgi:hypothetical protein